MAKLNKFIDKHLPKAILTAVGIGAFNIGGKTFEMMNVIDPDGAAFQELLKSSTSTIQIIILTIVYIFLKSQRMKK